jgi:hypothetical protein
MFRLFLLVGLLALSLPARGATAPAYQESFEKSAHVPRGWKTTGAVAIDEADAFAGRRSLALSCTPAQAGQPCEAVGPVFATQPGLWDIGIASSSDLLSPDASFDGIGRLEFLDAAHKVLGQATLVDIFGKNPWQPFHLQVEVPPGAVASRLHFALNKASGHFRLDDLSATYVGPAPHRLVERLLFSTAAQYANLLYPTDSKVVTISVLATHPLPAAARTVKFVVRDYWGAEQMAPLPVAQTHESAHDGKFEYTGTVDLSGVGLQQGKYYEMDGEIQAGEKPFTNHAGLAILPEAANNSFPAREVPFSGRNWDGRVPMTFEVAHRLGFRIMNIWSSISPDPPYKVVAPDIELCQKYHMGAIFGLPSYLIEGHLDNWQKYDEKALRGGVDSLLTTYGKTVDPCILDLGNEPSPLPERTAADVRAYSIIYDEAKKVDPKVIVLGTSVGPIESFFKAGFGAFCDAYDFHIYEDSENVGLALQSYRRLFRTYGHPHPVWSTELGLNSQGISRHTVAVDMVKKFAIFFANGGANLSWFDLFYPDADGTIAGSSGEAHDVIDSRFLHYNPKLTAITYYDLLNGISVKKFVEQRTYGADLRDFLFRDQDGHCLQIIWKAAGRQDVFLPLDGVQQATVVRLDGTHRVLQAGGKGVTLGLDEDPILLFYDGTASLPADLGSPAATLTALPTGLVRGGSTSFTVQLNGVHPANVALEAPPSWPVTATPSASAVTFQVTAPAETAAQEADLTVTLGDGQGGRTGEIYLRPPVAPQVAEQTLPVPATPGQPPAVKVVLKNDGPKTLMVPWSLALIDELPLIGGEYPHPQSTSARFTGPAKGRVTLAPGQTREFVVPLAGIDSQNAYHVRTTITDATGAPVEKDRNVAGFIAVPRAPKPLRLDGSLSDPAWKLAPVENINQARQYFSFDKITRWKGPKDLSGKLRFLWDDKFLYVGVQVTDDIAGGLQQDDMLWSQDGLQFLIDPCRGQAESVGKYDYAVAVGRKGAQAWCSLTADPGAPNGNALDIGIAYQRTDAKSGNINYEVAFPWSRLAPFRPGVGHDLGLTLILNEDDGHGRKSYMTWFGNANSKQVEAVGDLILTP